MKAIELKRAPKICCPEPGCDYAEFDFIECPGCGAKCKDCIHNKRKRRKENEV